MPAGRPKMVEKNQVFDVSKPGKSVPVGTSRPVITSRGAPIKDPVLAETANEDSKLADTPAPAVVRKKITPLAEQPKVEANASDGSSENITVSVNKAATASEAKNDKTAPEVKTEVLEAKIPTTTEESAAAVADTPAETVEAEETSNEEAKDLPTAAVAAEETPEKSEEPAVKVEAVPAEKTAAKDAVKTSESATEPDEKPAEETTIATEKPAEETKENEGETAESPPASAGSDEAAVDAVAQSVTKSKEEEKAAAEQAKRDAALQELIDSKKYFVPMAHDSSKEGGGKGLVIFLVFLLLIVGTYLAIDAELIDIGIELPFHILS